MNKKLLLLFSLVLTSPTVLIANELSDGFGLVLNRVNFSAKMNNILPGDLAKIDGQITKVVSLIERFGFDRKDGRGDVFVALLSDLSRALPENRPFKSHDIRKAANAIQQHSATIQDAARSAIFYQLERLFTEPMLVTPYNSSEQFIDTIFRRPAECIGEHKALSAGTATAVLGLLYWKWGRLPGSSINYEMIPAARQVEQNACGIHASWNAAALLEDPNADLAVFTPARYAEARTALCNNQNDAFERDLNNLTRGVVQYRQGSGNKVDMKNVAVSTAKGMVEHLGRAQLFNTASGFPFLDSDEVGVVCQSTPELQAMQQNPRFARLNRMDHILGCLKNPELRVPGQHPLNYLYALGGEEQQIARMLQSYAMGQGVVGQLNVKNIHWIAGAKAPEESLKYADSAPGCCEVLSTLKDFETLLEEAQSLGAPNPPLTSALNPQLMPRVDRNRQIFVTPETRAAILEYAQQRRQVYDSDSD